MKKYGSILKKRKRQTTDLPTERGDRQYPPHPNPVGWGCCEWWNRSMLPKSSLRRQLRHAGTLAAGRAPHADAVHRHPLAQRPHADQGSGVGERAARGADHRIEPDAAGAGLFHDLACRPHVAEPAERRVAGRGMDDVRPAALRGEPLRQPLKSRPAASCWGVAPRAGVWIETCAKRRTRKTTIQ